MRVLDLLILQRFYHKLSFELLLEVLAKKNKRGKVAFFFTGKQFTDTREIIMSLSEEKSQWVKAVKRRKEDTCNA